MSNHRAYKSRLPVEKGVTNRRQAYLRRIIQMQRVARNVRAGIQFINAIQGTGLAKVNQRTINALIKDFL